MERWEDIAGYAGTYQISDRGRVRVSPCAVPTNNSKNPGCVVTPKKTAGGYLCVLLRHASDRRTLQVHRLVCYAFIGPRPVGASVLHIDGNRTNNCLENLRYGHRLVPRKQVEKKQPSWTKSMASAICHFLTRGRCV